MDCVFCESCQSEVQKNDAYKAEFVWYCTECFDRLIVKKDEEKGLQNNHTDYNSRCRAENKSLTLTGEIK